MPIFAVKEGATITSTVSFYQDTCRNCGIVFLFPDQFKRDLNGRKYFCPNGHEDSFTVGETPEQILQKELRRKEQELSAKVLENYRIQADLILSKKSEKKTASRLKRIEKRAKAGKCLCCGDIFEDVAKHMRNKHPDKVEN